MMLTRYGFPIERLGDRYQLRSMLGSGGMADVYLAWDKQKEREVAIKVIKTDELSQSMLNYFTFESAQITRLQHPHIVQTLAPVQLELLDPGRSLIVPYTVMEYINGGDLQKRLQPGKPYRRLKDCVALFGELCEAVQYAHEQGIIHRDIKPENILFRQQVGTVEQIVVSDFGSALPLNTTEYRIAHAGSLLYVAPEQFTRGASKASDLFALGVVFYRLCSGRMPFRKSLQDMTLYKPPIPVSHVNSALPKVLDDVLLKSLSPKEEQRYGDVRSLLLAVHRACEQATSSNEGRSWNGLATRVEGGGGLFSTHYEPIPDDLTGTAFGYSSRDWSSPEHTWSAPLPPMTDPSLGGGYGLSRESDELYSTSNPRKRNTSDILNSRKFAAKLAVESSEIHSVQGPKSFTSLANKDTQKAGKTRKRSPWLIIGSSFLVLLFLAFFFIYSQVSGMMGLPLLPGMHPVLVLTIEPAGTNAPGDYTIDIAGEQSETQLLSHLLSYTQPEQSQIVATTGKKQINGVQAVGSLTIFNATAVPQTVVAGTVLTAGNIQIATDNDVTVPAITATIQGQVTVSAHAVPVGVGGNIPAASIDGACCKTGLTAKNFDAFNGGVDAGTVATVLQADIDGTAQMLNKSLIDAGQSGAMQQKAPGEDLVTSPVCTPVVRSDHNVGDEARNVTVTLKLNCSAMAYNRKQLQQILTKLYQKDMTKKQPDPNYRLTSDLRISKITGKVIDYQAGKGSLHVVFDGKVRYTFSEERKKAMYQQIKGLPLDQALKILQKQPGVAKVSADRQLGTVPIVMDQVQFKISNE